MDGGRCLDRSTGASLLPPPWPKYLLASSWRSSRRHLCGATAKTIRLGMSKLCSFAHQRAEWFPSWKGRDCCNRRVLWKHFVICFCAARQSSKLDNSSKVLKRRRQTLSLGFKRLQLLSQTAEGAADTARALRPSPRSIRKPPASIQTYRGWKARPNLRALVRSPS